MLYLESNTIAYIFLDVHQCSQCLHNTMASHETAVKRIFWYIRGTKDKSLVFNSPNKMVVDCYVDSDLRDWGGMKTLKTLFVL